MLVNAFTQGFNSVLYNGRIIPGASKSLEEEWQKKRDAEAKRIAGIVREHWLGFLGRMAYKEGKGYAVKELRAFERH